MGVHVAVEGLDGSGKSTLTAQLAIALGAVVPVTTTALPDGASFAGSLLEGVLQHRVVAPGPEALALAFAANRIDHYQRCVLPVRDDPQGGVVLSHRHLLSGLAYQGAQGLPLEWLSSINAPVQPPDVTLFLGTSPETCAQRLQRRGGRPELFETRLASAYGGFQAAIRHGESLGWRIEILDGELPVDLLVSQSFKLVLEALAARE